MCKKDARSSGTRRGISLQGAAGTNVSPQPQSQCVLYNRKRQALPFPTRGLGWQVSGHCSEGGEHGPCGGADSEEWSNRGLRTSISPVCEEGTSSGPGEGAGCPGEGAGMTPPPL
jgi:hypothetical protein